MFYFLTLIVGMFSLLFFLPSFLVLTCLLIDNRVLRLVMISEGHFNVKVSRILKRSGF